MQLKGQVAVVTGAGAGIGKVIALTLAREGASVVLVGHHIENVAKAAEEAGRFSKCVAKKADVSSLDDVTQAFKEIVEEFGRIDILVNNAAKFMNRVPPEDLTIEEWRRVIEVNLTGAFLCDQAAGSDMIKNKNGRIVNISSAGGHAAVRNNSAYDASKAGMMSLTKSLAVEWGKHNINVNSVSPGMTITPRIESRNTPESMKSREKNIPLGRACTSEDVANAVVFLVTPASDKITGVDIKVDGGLLAMHPGWV